MINTAIQKARNIPRLVAIQKKADHMKQTRRPVFAVTWDPRLPRISSIQLKHWRTMCSQDPRLAEVYKEPPLTVFKRQKNVRDHLIRAKLPPLVRSYPRGLTKGMNKCCKSCVICPFVSERKHIKTSKFTWQINSQVNCQTRNMVYMIECIKENCKERYIGESERTLHDRISEHVRYLRTNKEATGEHFNKQGHTLGDIRTTIIEKVQNQDYLYRKERESHHIRIFNTFYKGIKRTH